MIHGFRETANLASSNPKTVHGYKETAKLASSNPKKVVGVPG